MSKEQPTYHAKDILRYINGEMNATEMRALEMHALDDPFLQDAIDGYQEAIAEHKEAVIAGLRAVESFNPAERKEEKKVIPIWRSKILSYAAAAAVVISAGWFVFNISQPDQKLTGTKEKEATVQPTSTDTTTDAVEKSEAARGNSAPSLALTKEKAETITPAESSVSLQAEKNTVATAKKKEDVEENMAPTEAINDETTKAPATLSDQLQGKASEIAVSPPAQKMTASSLRKIEAAPQRKVFDSTGLVKLLQGKVYDNEEYPLENITIRQKGKSTAIVTDELGRFQMNIPDSGVVLIASGLGYKTREFRYSNQRQPFVLELEPLPQSLSEVVVSGYNTRNNKARAIVEVDTTEAVPTVGWEDFEEYLNNNKPQAKSKNKESVVVAFEINKDGKPESFEILRSGGKALDEEAIRLLKEGPAWKNKTGEASPMAKVTVGF